jgi:hypothetical protein
VSRFMAFHSLRITEVREVRRRFCSDSAMQTGFPLNAPFGSLPTGPHERCRCSTNQSAFHRRELPRKPAFELALSSALAAARLFARVEFPRSG